MPNFEVTIWQPCLLLRSALNFFQVTRSNCKDSTFIQKNN